MTVALNLYVKPSIIAKANAKKLGLESELKTATQQRDKAFSSFDIEYIAKPYRQDNTLAFLVKTLSEERAFSLQQAYNAYDDKIEADRQEKLRREEIEELKRLKNEGININLNGKDAGSELAKGVLLSGAAILGGKITKEAIKEVSGSKIAKETAKNIAKHLFD